MKKQLAIISFILLISFPVFSKAQPKGTDIFIADLNIKNEIVKITNPVNITDREGYDNQPSFTDDGKNILYTSIRDDKQADIYSYDIVNKTTSRLTNTSESEFSPIITPDKKHFSVVRVEKDDTQRLWQFSTDGNNPELVLESILPVGYYCWANEHTIAMFILGEHNTLQVFDKNTGKLDIVESDVGRSLKKIPAKNAISFLHKISDKNWQIKELDLDTMKTKSIIKALDKSEDFVWYKNNLLMAKGSKLFKFSPGKDKNWVEITDFKNTGIKDILRLAVSPNGDKLAFVSNIP